MITKICSICSKEKDINDFYKQNKVDAKGKKYIYYNPECKECSKERSTRWNKKNFKRRRELRIKYYKEGKWIEKDKLSSKRQRENGYFLEWSRKNKDKLKIYAERRAHKNHKISNNEWEECKKYFNYSCAYCGMTEKEHKKIYNQQLHKEHVDHEGANDLSNCVPSCKSCNSSKWDKNLDEWYSKNDKFIYEKYHKIIQWITKDYKNYIDKVKI